RAVAPEVAEIGANLLLYDLDDLQRVVHENRGGRSDAVEGTTEILVAELHKFLALRTYATFSPAIAMLRERFDKVREEALAVVAGSAQAGVHSLKDVPTTLPDGLVLASVLARGAPEDVLVSRERKKLADLPRGARIATGSIRRIAMVKHLRPDIEIVAIRGNVDTRLAELERG